MFGYMMVGALSVGIVGGVCVTAFAASETTATEGQAVAVKTTLDDVTKEKVQDIMDELKINLSELGVEIPEKKSRGDLFSALDEETKVKAKNIMEQKKEGTITSEEAKTQLAELGIELPVKGDKRGNILTGLDEETKEKAQLILAEKKAGTITSEEASSISRARFRVSYKR